MIATTVKSTRWQQLRNRSPVWHLGACRFFIARYLAGLSITSSPSSLLSSDSLEYLSFLPSILQRSFLNPFVPLLSWYLCVVLLHFQVEES